MNRSVITRLVKLEAAAAAYPVPRVPPPWAPAARRAAEVYLRAELVGLDAAGVVLQDGCGCATTAVDAAMERAQLVQSEAGTRWSHGASTYWRSVIGKEPHSFDARTAPPECVAAGDAGVEALSHELAGGMWPPYLWRFRLTRDAYERAYGQPWPPADVAARNGWRAPTCWAPA